MDQKKGYFTKLSKVLAAGTGVIVLAGGGLLAGYQIEKHQAKPVMKYVQVMITPTLLPTASPSATLAPTRKLINTTGGYGAVTVKPTVASGR